MLYAIISQDVPDSGPLRSQARPRHLARIELLRDTGRLVLAGPFPAADSPDPGPEGYTGSLIVAEFDDLQQAQQWADSDPYADAGVYLETIVKPFKLVLP